MELPKNITQIGESDRNCKIYVEDYVISYIKQMNHLAENKDMAVALYGTRKEENDVAYLFFYGACKLDFLQREVRHLSQAQCQEIEKQRQKYFREYQFLGYRLLNGEMVEGFHICEQEICRYIKGYACFYEKNDGMLAYMLDTRQEETKPEEVDQEKYDRVKQRQEERRQQHEDELRPRMEKREERPRQEEPKRSERAAAGSSSGTVKPPPGTLNMKVMRASVIGAFALLCILGLTSLGSNGKIDSLKAAVGEFFRDLTEKKLPDGDNALEAMNPSVQPDTLVAEDKLTDAIRQENAGQNGQAGDGSQPGTQPAAGQDNPASTDSPQGNTTPDAAAPGNTGTADGAANNGQAGGLPPIAGNEAGGAGQTGDPAQAGGANTPASGNTTPPADSSAANGNEQKDGAAAVTTPQTPAPVSYTIQTGDTLIGISLRKYGTESKVKEICTLNNITNPDNIQEGQKILLP